MSRRLIVGCGYLGHRVGRRWLRQGHVVHVMTRSEQNAEGFREEGFVPVVGDVVDWSRPSQLPIFDQTLYAVGFDRSASHDKRTVYVNGLANVLDQLGDSAGQFLYVSSTSVYGQTDGAWVDEESETTPQAESGLICLDAESTVWDASGRYEKLQANVLRFAGIYGPGRLLRRIDQMKSAERIGGNPDSYLNLIHVDDGARVLDAAIEEFQDGRRWLVCDGEPLTRREYYRTLADLLQTPEPEFDPSMGARSSTLGLNKRCSNSRVVNELQVAFEYPDARAGLAHSIAAKE